MTYKIQTLPAEALITDQWATVDDINDVNEVMDHIASPTFHWQDDLLVRCWQIAYYGVYKNGEVIDLSDHSNVKKNNAFDWNQASKMFQSDLSYPEMWQQSMNASWMMHGVRKFTKRRADQIILHLYDELSSELDENIFRPVNLYIDNYKNKTPISMTRLDPLQRESVYGSPIYHIVEFVKSLHYAYPPASTIQQLASAFALYFHGNREKGEEIVQSEMADEIRKYVSFREIVGLIT